MIGAGVALHRCLLAADRLAPRGIRERVIDLYSIKPVDVGTLVAAAEATEGRVVVAEAQASRGGLGSAVAAAVLGAGVRQLHLAHLSVSELPGSVRTEELLSAAVIDAPHIAAAAGALVDGRRGSEPTERRSDEHGA